MNNTQSVAVQLSSWAAIGDWRLMFLDRDRVREATVADAQRTALAYLKSSNRTVGLFIPGEPDRAEIPERADITAMLQGYTGDEARAEGEAFDPTPANIDARTTRVELPNGIKLVMLPKETRGDAVNAVIRLNYGDENSLKGIGRYAGLMIQMLMRGSRGHTRQEIEDELARLQSQLNIGGGSGVLLANLQSTRPNLAATIELAAEILREPAFPDAELDTLKDLSLASIESGRSEPQSVVGVRLFTALGAQLPARRRALRRNGRRRDRLHIGGHDGQAARAALRIHRCHASRDRRDRRLRSERGPSSSSPSGSATGAARSRSATC